MVAIDDMIREIELQSDVYLHCISETTTLGPEKKKNSTNSIKNNGILQTYTNVAIPFTYWGGIPCIKKTLEILDRNCLRGTISKFAKES